MMRLEDRARAITRDVHALWLAAAIFVRRGTQRHSPSP